MIFISDLLDIINNKKIRLYSMHRYLFLAFIILAATGSNAQLSQDKTTYTKADTLRGMLTSLRTCYDINFYHLDISIDIDKRSISGSTLFSFTANNNFKKLQIDLFENLQIEQVIYKKQKLAFTREFNAVYIDFPEQIETGAKDEFTVYYSGSPHITENAPWDGGFVFAKDSLGKSWIAVACQGLGASSWWPNKDHQSDEPDSMLISVTVPSPLINVSNGTLRSVQKLNNGHTRYNWFVSYPINNYCATINVGDFAHFSDVYMGEAGTLQLDYYVLKENLTKAQQHFKVNVKPMLKAFEYWFGPYPFYRDGYKLVETPYLGLENQTAIAYGNKYQQGYNGKDWSGTGLGLSWDYLIVHESGHEWFGNNITAKDIADMWIHESFATYAEGLFVESNKGAEAGTRYIKGLRSHVKNDSPIIGTYNVNKEGSGDMYFKGANMLHTIRTIINDDLKWRNILRELNNQFGLKTTTTEEVVNYINKTSGINLTKVFDQYLRYTEIPVLEIKKSANIIHYRWKVNVKDFEMPVKVKYGTRSSTWKTIRPTTEWQTLKSKFILADTDNFFIKTKIIRH